MSVFRYFLTTFLLFASVALQATNSTVFAQQITETKPIRLVEREVFFPTREGVRMNGASFYAKSEGLEKLRYRSEQTASDKADNMEISRSVDNGKTWSSPEEIIVVKKTTEGIMRRIIRPGWIDPATGNLLIMDRVIIGKTDSVLARFGRGTTMGYIVSRDGWRTETVRETVEPGNVKRMEDGLLKDERYPKQPIFSMMYGDRTGQLIRNGKGEILQPVQLVLFDPEGKKLYNPGKAYTFTQAAVLIGEPRKDHRIDWTISSRVELELDRSTRGAIEPTLAKLADGRILMVVRGSNDRSAKKIPGYKWFSISEDGGHIWGDFKPWTYTNGENFYSPSSCSQLVQHSNGNTYWLGNITPKNPTGNLPRWPFVIGQVDSKSGLLMKETVVTVDEPQKDDNTRMMLSNFFAYEDRDSNEILLHLNRTFSKGVNNWTTPAYLYRIAVE